MKNDYEKTEEAIEAIKEGKKKSLYIKFCMKCEKAFIGKGKKLELCPGCRRKYEDKR